MRRTCHARRRVVPHSGGRSVVVAATVGVFALAIAVGFGATGGTYALWSSNENVNGSSVSTGSTKLTVENVTDYSLAPSLAVQALYPGRSVVTSTPLRLKNTGSTRVAATIAPATFSSTSATMQQNLAIAATIVATSTCSASAAGVTPVSTSGPINVASGQTVNVCVEVRLSAAAPAELQGGAATFTITINGTQVRP